MVNMNMEQVLNADFYKLQELLVDYKTLLVQAVMLSSYQVIDTKTAERLLLTSSYKFSRCPIELKEIAIHTEEDVFRLIANSVITVGIEGLPFETENNLSVREDVAISIFLKVIDIGIKSGCLDILPAFPIKRGDVLGNGERVVELIGGLITGLYLSYNIPKKERNAYYTEAFI